MEQESLPTDVAVTPPGSMTPARRLLEAAVVLVSSLALQFLMIAVLAGTVGAVNISAVATQPHFPLWALALAVIAVAVPSRRSLRLTWYVVAAAVVFLAVVVVQYGPWLLPAGGLGFLGLVPHLIGMITFTAAAAFGVGVAVLIPNLQPVDRRSALARTLVVVGWLAALSLPVQFLSVYFTLGSTVPIPDDFERIRYPVTVVTALALLVTGAVLARRGGKRGTVTAGWIGVAVAVLLALIFAVPRIEFGNDLAADQHDDGYTPCLGEDCPGG